MEHRWGTRYSLDVPVRFTDGCGAPSVGRLRDVSLSGAFLHCRAPLWLLAPVQLSIPVEGFSLALRCSVVRKAEDGYGLEWRDAETVDLDLLLALAGSRLRHSVPRSPMQRSPLRA